MKLGFITNYYPSHYPKYKSYEVMDNGYTVAYRRKMARVLPSFKFFVEKKNRINVKHPNFVIER